MGACLALAPEREFRPARIGFGFAIPELKALHKAVALQRDSAAVSACPDDVADLQNFRLAVTVVDHDSIKLYRCILNAYLQETVAPCGLPHLNVVMVMLAVNVGLAKIAPVCGMS